MSKELVTDDVGRPEIKEGKMMYVVLGMELDPELGGRTVEGGTLELVGGIDSGGPLLTGGDWVETLLAGIEEGGQPIPNREHRSPVVLGGGGWV
jgi:hypothetical protein